MHRWSFLAVILVLSFQGWVSAEGTKTDLHFDFGSGKTGFTRVSPKSAYSKEAGFGFEPGSEVKAGGNCCASDKPFLFSVAVPEGNYKVTVTLGDGNEASTTTVKAELRRLMLEKVHTDAGKTETRIFTVNVRTPLIAGGGEVHLKPREKTSETMAWDDKLTLEFNGDHPSVVSLEIASADDVPTVYILGDSTVCDQPKEPWNSWGQMLTRFLKPDVVVANHAESGESLRSSLGAKRLDKVLGEMKAGDYLFVQYGHNDMKEKGEGVGAFTTYKADLKRFVDGAKKKGGIPVLVTSMERKAGVDHETLGDYPEAVRQVAKEENVTLIDLNTMSKTLYKAMGSDLGKAFQDGTHHNNYGSYEMAKCVIEGIKKSDLPLAKSIVDDFGDFDPG
ncbi:MAG TPA: rhamnogalacturonan acetylesterase, partial [Tepidisphaeraceae bacterium]|nr:rhamnogalacturonan acetylesterase [Tepidisphaeraceae bacterium]